MQEPPTVGVPRLDRLLAPIPPHANIALIHDQTAQADVFLYQAAHEQLSRGKDVIYAVFERAPAEVRQAMQDYGFATARSPRLRFLDARAERAEPAEPGTYHPRTPADAEHLLSLLSDIADSHSDALLLCEGLHHYANLVGATAFAQAKQRLNQAMRRFRLALTLLPSGREQPARLLEDFEGVVALRGDQTVLLNQYFLVQRATWKEPLPARPVPYRTHRPGGVLVYIPKILVTGPYHAGKSTFVQTLSDTAVSVNRLGTTVAMDHGHVQMDGLTADIFGTPGQERFDPLLKTIAGQALGVIVVVDSSRPDSFARAQQLMELTGKAGLPMVVAANKQDLPLALKPDEVARRLDTPSHVKTLPCIGQERESSRGVLRTLIEQILNDVS